MFVVHLVINFIIYEAIGKEEVLNALRPHHPDSPAFLIAIFTFRWSKSYQEYESRSTVRLMKISNVLAPILIVFTFAGVVMWAISYGK